MTRVQRTLVVSLLTLAVVTFATLALASGGGDGHGGVITSYSIHYTKLYDGSCPLGAEDRVALDLCAGLPTLVVRNKSDLGLVPFDLEFSAFSSLEVSTHSGEGLRITSYNVCYTKLLR